MFLKHDLRNALSDVNTFHNKTSFIRDQTMFRPSVNTALVLSFWFLMGVSGLSFWNLEGSYVLVFDIRRGCKIVFEIRSGSLSLSFWDSEEVIVVSFGDSEGQLRPLCILCLYEPYWILPIVLMDPKLFLQIRTDLIFIFFARNKSSEYCILAFREVTHHWSMDVSIFRHPNIDNNIMTNKFENKSVPLFMDQSEASI